MLVRAESLVDSNVILQRVGRIRKCVAALETIRRTHSESRFMADEMIQAAAERNLQVVIQSVLDICNHAVADMKLEVPDEQKQALLDAWHGRLGGPLADLNGLIKEDLATYNAPIEHKLTGGEGTIAIGDKVRATMAPYKSAYGTATTLRDSIFSTIAGAPAYVSKASEHVVNIPEHNMVWTFKDRNAIQGDFRLEA